MDKTNFLYGMLIAALFAIIFCSCGPTKEEWEADQARKIKNGEVFDYYDVIVVDGCEYLSRQPGTHSHNGSCDQFTHKGNCKNPIHQK